MLCLLSSSPATSYLVSLSKTIFDRPSLALNLSRSQFQCHLLVSTMPATARLSSHAFAGNPTRSRTPKSSDPLSPTSAFQTLKTLLSSQSLELSSPDFKVLPFRKGQPLVGSSADNDSGAPNWYLGWLSLGDCKTLLENSEVNLNEDSLIYLGYRAEDDVVYWAIDLSEASNSVSVLGARQFCFVELRTLMVATDWADARAMGDLAVAGHARALLEWHSNSRFCGHCGAKTTPLEAGRRKRCSNELCQRRVYPRVDPVVIMLVIDKENDHALLSRQSRFMPRLWSCLAGFIEPGESLEEAVRRETFEETGIEVGDVVYHSSQPWPVGPSGIPCQLMVGFFAYAKSLEIHVDKEELEDAKWHSREDIQKALIFAEYKKAQKTAAAKVDQMCEGVEKVQNLSADYNVQSGVLAPMFIPGPFAIAHHLISSWANQTSVDGTEAHANKAGASVSSL